MRRRSGESAGRLPGANEPIRQLLALGLVLVVAAGLLLAAAVIQEWAFLAWLAAIAAASAGLTLASSGLGHDATRRVHLDSGTVTAEFRRSFIVAMAVFFATMAAFVGFHVVVGDDDLAHRLLGALVFLICASLLPDLIRAALTRSYLTFDDTSIRVRSWTTEASVEWADVTRVEGDFSIDTRPAVRIVTRPGAPTLEIRRRRILVPLEPRTPPGQIVVNAIALDEPWLLMGWLNTLVGDTPERRAQVVGNQATLDHLTGRIQPRR